MQDDLSLIGEWTALRSNNNLSLTDPDVLCLESVVSRSIKNKIPFNIDKIKDWWINIQYQIPSIRNCDILPNQR
jgi:hypothetical protein